MSNSVFQILLLLVSLAIQASGAAPQLARRKCNETCGNITIPFPFGVGAGCFLDDWYKNDCQQSNTVPILNKTGLRVLNTSLPSVCGYTNGMIGVLLPLIYSNASCGGDGLGEAVSFEGGPFVFSQTRNVFTSVGCNTLATVSTTESAVVGCRLKYLGTSTNVSRYYSACSGRDECHQSTPPFNLQVFTVDFKEEGRHHGCKHAFLADRSWFLKSNDTGLYGLRLDNTVRVVLEWGIADNTYYSRELMQQNYSEIYSLSYNQPFNCDSSFSGIEMPFMQCYCGTGYYGNPYLITGCEDINECEDPQNCNGTCLNKQGYYC